MIEKIIFEVWGEILGPPIVSKTYNCLKSDKFNPPRVNYLPGLSWQITSFLKTSKIVENDVLAVTKYSKFSGLPLKNGSPLYKGLLP